MEQPLSFRFRYREIIHWERSLIFGMHYFIDRRKSTKCAILRRLRKWRRIRGVNFSPLGSAIVQCSIVVCHLNWQDVVKHHRNSIPILRRDILQYHWKQLLVRLRGIWKKDWLFVCEIWSATFCLQRARELEEAKLIFFPIDREFGKVEITVDFLNFQFSILWKKKILRQYTMLPKHEKIDNNPSLWSL